MTEQEMNAFMAIFHRHSGGTAYAETVQAIRTMEQHGWKFIPPATQKESA